MADLELLVSEVVTNAVQHTRTAGQDEESQSLIVVHLYRTGAGVRVEVSDRDPAHPVPVEEPVEVGHGWGLQLLSQLSSAWGVRPASAPEGKAVWFELPWPT